MKYLAYVLPIVLILCLRSTRPKVRLQWVPSGPTGHISWFHREGETEAGSWFALSFHSTYPQAYRVSRTIIERKVTYGAGSRMHVLPYLRYIRPRPHQSFISHGGFCFGTSDRGTSGTCGKHNTKNGESFSPFNLPTAQ